MLAGSEVAGFVPPWRSGFGRGVSKLLMPQVASDWWSYWRYAGASRQGSPFKTPAFVVRGARAVWPFLANETTDAWSLGGNAGPTILCHSMEWMCPVDMTVTRVTRFSNRLAAIGVGARYWSDTPTDRPRHWGVRFTVTFQF